MRKLLALLLAALLVFSCVGCGEKEASGATTAPQKTETTTTVPTQVTTLPSETEQTTDSGEPTTTVADETTTAPSTTTTAGAVKCDHADYSRADCTNPAVCNACGAEVKPAAGHKFYNGKCLICKIADPNMAVKSVKLDKTEVTLLAGATVDLKATVDPAAAATTLTWTSSDAKIAKVSATGKVEAMAVGEATITAECGGKTATCKVKVVALTLVMEGGDFPTSADDMVELAYPSDYSPGLKTFFGITKVTYDYNAATRELKVSFVGNITYNGAGNPTPTTPSFGARVMAGNGSTAGDLIWKADHADSPPAQYTDTLVFENVGPGPYTIGFYSTFGM